MENIINRRDGTRLLSIPYFQNAERKDSRDFTLKNLYLILLSKDQKISSASLSYKLLTKKRVLFTFGLFNFYLFLILGVIRLNAQPNCEAFKYYGNTTKYNACKKAEEAEAHYQFSKEHQEIMDEAIKIDSTFDYAYRQKSVAYLKSGDFITWKKLIDKAVYYKPVEHLGARAWGRFSWFRDYHGTIKDIEELERLASHDIGYSSNGTYHLHIVRAICYGAVGEREKAIEIMEGLFRLENYNRGIYDYWHLGALYFKAQQFDKAMASFLKQQKEQDFAENKFYLAMAYKATHAQANYLALIQEAATMYKAGDILREDYNHNYDKIFLEDILAELALSKKEQEQTIKR